MKQIKLRGGTLFSLAAVVFYILFFPSMLSRETVFEPVWALDLREVRTPYVDRDVEGAVGFRLGSRNGYVGVDGKLKLLHEILFDVAWSDDGFIGYSRIPGSLILRDTDGDPVRSFMHDGYPAFSEAGDRLFVFFSDSTGLKELTLEDEEVWRSQFPSLMTSFCSNADQRLVGLANGELRVFDRSGAPVQEIVPGGSRIPVVLGCAVGRTGLRAAAAGGIDPQRLVILHARDDRFVEESSVELPSSYRREIFMRFSADERLLYLEQPGGFAIYDTQSGETASLRLTGSIAGFAELPDRRMVLLLSNREGGRALVACGSDGVAVLNEDLPGSECFIRSVENGFLLGSGGRLMLVECKED